MSDFTIRADSVDVEQIMRQIRGRIRDKRGVDYTEEQIRELAAAKLERFLDPTGVRSDLLEQFRTRPSLPPGFLYQFEDTTLFDSDKPIVRFFRKLLHPFLKLLFNPNVLSTTLHKQAAFNQYVHAHQPLQFELLHNLVLELTRATIEVKNLKMRLESVQSRLEFNERRGRALEAVVQYKPEAPVRGDRRDDNRRDQSRGEHTRGQGSQARSTGAPAPQRPPERAPQARPPQGPPPPQGAPQAAAAAVALEEPATPGTEPQGGIDPITGGDSLRTRRRRRRRGRRSSGEQGAADAARAVDGGGAGAEGADAEDGDSSMPDSGGDLSSPPASPPASTPTSPPWSPASVGLPRDAAPDLPVDTTPDVQRDTPPDLRPGADSAVAVRLAPDATDAAAGDAPAQARLNPNATPDRDDERQ